MPEEKKMGLIRLPMYTPANGSEGYWFEGWWCGNCKHEPTDDDEGCQIPFFKCISDEGDKAHPAEWVTIPGGISICTAFEARSPEHLQVVQMRVWQVAAHQKTLHDQEAQKEKAKAEEERS